MLSAPQEVASNTRLSSASELHCTLLEDDAVIARINVETDRLLATPDPSRVRPIIRLTSRATRVIYAIQLCTHKYVQHLFGSDPSDLPGGIAARRLLDTPMILLGAE
jgi:hypothetical protein